MGLLLATRVLPKGDTTALSAAREAIGDAFLARLLLPLDSFGDPGAQEISDFFQVRSSRIEDRRGEGEKRLGRVADWLD